MEHDVIEAIRSRIKDQKSSIEQFMVNGMAKTFDDYQRMVGEYSSLKRIEDDLDDIERRVIEN